MDQICEIKTIGITRKDCDCIEALPESLKNSPSGYYLHELSGVEEIQTVQDIVSCEDLSDFYETLLENALREVTDDLSAQITERYSRKDFNFSGVMGSRSSGKTLNIDKDFIALKIIPSSSSDGTLIIKSVGLSFDKTLTGITATLYRYYKDTAMIEEVDVIEGLSSTANSFTDNTIEPSIKLPMSIQGEGQIEYYVVIPRNDFQPRNNSNSCGCGGKERKLLSQLTFSGVSGNEVEDVYKWPSTEKVNGIVLNIEIRCDAEQFICAMAQNEEGWNKYFSQALLYKTAWKLHKEILSSKKLTQSILMDRETVHNNMNEFDTEYWSRIRYLVQNMNTDLTSCYQCNGRLKMSRILV